MGKSKTTKSDGVANFADTQDLGDQKRMPRGVMGKGVQSTKNKR